MQYTHFIITLTLSLFCAAQSGCLAKQNYEHPQNVTATDPNAWNGRIEEAISPEQLDPQILAKWWTTLGDEKLNSLIDRATKANLDLKQATSQLKQARALRKIAGAGYLPSAQAGGSALKTDGGSLYSSGVDATWEIDVFGGTQSNVQATQADLDAVKEARRDVLVTILAEVALNYADLRTLQARKTLTINNLKSQQESLKVNQAQFKAGSIAQLDVDRAANQVETTKAQIPKLEVDIDKAKNRLAVLLGQLPGALHDELEPKPLPLITPKVAVGIPAQVLRRRPDVRRAERQLAAETYRIGVAKAELYPKFTLSGTVGLEASSFKDFFTGDTFGIGPGFQWNIFSGGRIRQEIKAQTAVQEEALILYEKSILVALEDVENAITAFGKEQVRHDSLEKAYISAKSAANLAMNRYEVGEGDYLIALDAQRTVFSSEDQLAMSRGQITANLISLYKALGGGWDPEAPENTENPDRPEEK